MTAPTEKATRRYSTTYLFAPVFIAAAFLAVQGWRHLEASAKPPESPRTAPPAKSAPSAKSAAPTVPASWYTSTLTEQCPPADPASPGRTEALSIDGSNVSYTEWAAKFITYHRQRSTEYLGLYREPITLLDVGAHTGKISFTTLAMARGHRVVAVEPVAVNVEALCRTALQNGWLGSHSFKLFHAAMSDKQGNVTIYVPKRNCMTALSKASAQNRGVAVAEETTTIVGDELLEEGGFRPSFIKIDTQGHELFVLRGLRKYLAAAGPGEVLVFAEHASIPMYAAKVDPYDIWALMVDELGYTPYCKPNLVVRGKIASVQDSKPRARSVFPPKNRDGCGDLVFLKG